MILLRWLTRTWRGLTPPAPRLPGPEVLPSYASMGRYVAGGATLEPRLRLFVQQLAAELAGCRWCVEHGRHLWRQAFLSLEQLRGLRGYAESRLFSEKERAALAFTEAVSRYTDRAGGVPEAVLTELRRHFSEPEVAALTLAVSSEHFFNPATGALGADARPALTGDAAATGQRERGGEGARRAAGSAIRNLW